MQSSYRRQQKSLRRQRRQQGREVRRSRTARLAAIGIGLSLQALAVSNAHAGNGYGVGAFVLSDNAWDLCFEDGDASDLINFNQRPVIFDYFNSQKLFFRTRSAGSTTASTRSTT